MKRADNGYSDSNSPDVAVVQGAPSSPWYRVGLASQASTWNTFRCTGCGASHVALYLWRRDDTGNEDIRCSHTGCSLANDDRPVGRMAPRFDSLPGGAGRMVAGDAPGVGAEGDAGPYDMDPIRDLAPPAARPTAQQLAVLRLTVRRAVRTATEAASLVELLIDAPPGSPIAWDRQVNAALVRQADAVGRAMGALDEYRAAMRSARGDDFPAELSLREDVELSAAHRRGDVL